jgi:hypothetical protein
MRIERQKDREAGVLKELAKKVLTKNKEQN